MRALSDGNPGTGSSATAQSSSSRSSAPHRRWLACSSMRSALTRASAALLCCACQTHLLFLERSCQVLGYLDANCSASRQSRGEKQHHLLRRGCLLGNLCSPRLSVLIRMLLPLLLACRGAWLVSHLPMTGLPGLNSSVIFLDHCLAASMVAGKLTSAGSPPEGAGQHLDEKHHPELPGQPSGGSATK